MNGKRLSGGLGVNFDENKPGTGVRVAFRNAVIDFQCLHSLSQQERERICAFLEERGPTYFKVEDKTVAAEARAVLIRDLEAAGFVL